MTATLEAAPGKETVLIVDDDQELRDLIADILGSSGRRCLGAGTALEAMHLIRAECPAVVLVDIGLPDSSGLVVLSETASFLPGSLVIMITGRTDEKSVVESMRLGAMDYLAKPFDMGKLQAVVEEAFKKWRSNGRTQGPATTGKGKQSDRRLVGESPAMMDVFKLIGRLARSDVPVLITGDSGTGKELVAQALHTYGPKASGPFVVVDCAGLPESLLESELFGYEKGAFTGAGNAKPGRIELAHGGTLFLDEIGNIPLSLQVKLLRVLQDRATQRLGSVRSIKFEARLVTATNMDIKDQAAKGMFREDLLYRIAGAEIHLPALRDKLADLEILTRSLLDEIACLNGRWEVSRESFACMRAYSWPGNVRELEHALHQATALCQGHVITPGDLSVEVREGSVCLDPEFVEAIGTRKLLSMQEVRRRYARHVLVACGGNRARAARVLSIDRKTLNVLVGTREVGGQEI